MRSRVVYPEHFLLAAREWGYRSTAHAVAEFVDNAVQAKATEVSIAVTGTGPAEWPIEILVTDDGEGMTERALASALAFGGTTRFDDRQSLGRYGMGLPNGAL